MKNIINRLRYLSINLGVLVINLFVKRNPNSVLIGAWMGEKFSDNSRYLFQFLSDNKEELSLKNVVWVTRNEKIFQELTSKGYQVYMCGTLSSFYWHVKTGTHILCNAIYVLQNGRFQPDIQTCLSYGAKRVQLWHGVGLKAIGTASNKSKLGKLEFNPKRFSFLRIITTPGGWFDYSFLTTSPKYLEANFQMSFCNKDKMFISCYPRNCECLWLLNRETEIIDQISEYKTKIIYLPTFRSDYSNYRHPLEDPNLIAYIEQNDILWIEKQHSASDFTINDVNSKNIFSLDDNFDVNVIYDFVDIVISDYSSAAFDAIYKDIPMIMYTPDLEDFKNGDVGFVYDINYYCNPFIVYNLNDLISSIDRIYSGYYFNDQTSDAIQLIKSDFFENRESDYNQFWEDFQYTMKKEW